MRYLLYWLADIDNKVVTPGISLVDVLRVLHYLEKTQSGGLLGGGNRCRAHEGLLKIYGMRYLEIESNVAVLPRIET